MAEKARTSNAGHKSEGDRRPHRFHIRSVQLDRLPPFDEDCLVVVVETPEGSSNKLEFEPRYGAFLFLVFPGCLVPARALGVIAAEQSEAGHTTRNDRSLAVAVNSATHRLGPVRNAIQRQPR